MKKILQNQTIQQLISYSFVGISSTMVEWIMFWLWDYRVGLHYVSATVLSFFVATFANWMLGHLTTFRGTELHIVKEMISVYLASMVGLALNLILMYTLIEKAGMQSMTAKITATGMVFVWNFLIRKLVIYRENYSVEGE